MRLSQARTIAGPFSRLLFEITSAQRVLIATEWFIATLRVWHLKVFTDHIIKIIIAGVLNTGVILSTKICYTLGVTQGVISARHMIGNYIDDNFHALRM